jgi:hypothetical protein
MLTVQVGFFPAPVTANRDTLVVTNIFPKKTKKNQCMHARKRNKMQARKDPIALRRHATASTQAVSVLEYIRRPVTHRAPYFGCSCRLTLHVVQPRTWCSRARGAAAGAVVGWLVTRESLSPLRKPRPSRQCLLRIPHQPTVQYVACSTMCRGGSAPT